MNNSAVNNVLPVALTPALPGQVISVSCNVLLALSFLEGYLNSTYSLQAADTQLEETISTDEATLVQQFQQDMNGPNPPYDATNTYSNWLYQLSQATDQNTISQDAQLYAGCNAENQAETKVMDGNNSTAQNTMSQNSQGQQGVIQTMSSINSISANLTRLIQG